jgi:hypothetical protein
MEDQREWKCRSCESIFESRGRRDRHHKKTHQRSGAGKSGGLQVEREEEGGKFVCQCGREYDEARSLMRHREKCNTLTILRDPEEDAGAFPPNRANNR